MVYFPTKSPRGTFHPALLKHRVKTSAFSPSERSRLRLQAAVSLAYLSGVDAYAQVTVPHFVLLALTMQVQIVSATPDSVLWLSVPHRIRVSMSVPVS